MRKLLLLLLSTLLIISCASEPSTDGYRLYPNPYSPAAGYLKIVNKDGSNLAVGRYSVRVFNYNLKLVYEGSFDLAAAGILNYPGINQAGEKLAPGTYFVQVISSTASPENTESSYINLLVQ